MAHADRWNAVDAGSGDAYQRDGRPLDECHISPQSHLEGSLWIKVHEGGDLIELNGGTEKSRKPRLTGIPRGNVVGFSRKSKARLCKFMATVDADALEPGETGFITGTLPGGDVDHWLPYALRFKRLMDTWFKRVERVFPTCWIVWKLEPQQRGAPHFHALVGNVPNWALASLELAWWEVVGSGDADHRLYGCDAQPMRDWSQASIYASKYMGKETAAALEAVVDRDERIAALWSSPGRYWGIRGREHLPIKPAVYKLSPRAYYQARRIMRRYAKARGYRLSARRNLFTFMRSKDQQRLLDYLGAYRL